MLDSIITKDTLHKDLEKTPIFCGCNKTTLNPDSTHEHFITYKDIHCCVKLRVEIPAPRVPREISIYKRAT